MSKRDIAWSMIGIGAVIFSCWLLYNEVRNISLAEIADSLRAISLGNWFFAAIAVVVNHAAGRGESAAGVRLEGIEHVLQQAIARARRVLEALAALG